MHAGRSRAILTAESSTAPPVPTRRGPPPTAITPNERQVIETVAQAFPWYGYKKIALICGRLDEAVPRQKVYRVMKEAALLHRCKRRITPGSAGYVNGLWKVADGSRLVSSRMGLPRWAAVAVE